jgi:xylulokinase
MKYFLGIDIGTSGCKAVICTSDGKMLGRAWRKNELLTSSKGFAEEYPSQWWENTCEIIREVITLTKVSPKSIAGVGVSCLGAVMAVNKYGNLLTNAIMQMDKRSIKQMDRLRKLEKKSGVVFQNPVSNGVSMLQTLMWIKECRPDIYKNTYKFLMPNGYIIYMMTGIMMGDYSRSSTTLLFNFREKCWSQQMCNISGISMKKLPKLYESSRIVGGISESAAKQTGLIVGTPVIAGTLDTAAAGIAVGAVEKGDTYMILGTFGKVCICIGPEDLGDRRFAYFTYPAKNKYILMISNDGGCGLSVNWFKDCFGENEVKEAEESDKSVYAILDEKANNVEAGSRGVIYLPFLTGGKSPEWDLYAKGVFFGFDKNHNKGHFFRAIMEGIAYSARMNIELVEKSHNVSINNIYISGGGSNSKVWLQIIADVLGKKLIISENPADSEAIGAASIVAKNILGLSNYTWLKSNAVEEIIPNMTVTNVYDRYFNLFKELYCSFGKHFKSLHKANQ